VASCDLIFPEVKKILKIIANKTKKSQGVNLGSL
jgi:hypothetical protein